MENKLSLSLYGRQSAEGPGKLQDRGPPAADDLTMACTIGVSVLVDVLQSR